MNRSVGMLNKIETEIPQENRMCNITKRALHRHQKLVKFFFTLVKICNINNTEHNKHTSFYIIYYNCKRNLS